MERILEHFRAITATPRCSCNAIAMKEYIKAFALQHHFNVQEDSAGNILCQKGTPKVCLQAHYDMVCIGSTEFIEIIVDGKWIKAKNSTLGADNGMGMAIMFWLMEEMPNLECLFSADEEVGLLGAMAFNIPLKASNLLNLDAEDEGEIYIGCAGGVDVIATISCETIALPSNMHCYEISAFDFLGGHSGVDIDKKIPSAIKALGYELSLHEGIWLISIEGGERRNAIPKSAKALIASNQPLSLHDNRLKLTSIPLTNPLALKHSSAIIHALGAFAQGIRSWDRDLDIPSTSINLGVITKTKEFLRFDCSARAMDDEHLGMLAHETQTFFKGFGFDVTQEGWHGAWKPEVGTFAILVQNIMQENHYKHAPFKAIHAGLECGELIARQPKKVEAVSIGPTICYPHSLREMCDLDSVKNTAIIVRKIVETL